MEAAAQVFEERGYAATTTNRIAERAGVAVGSLYQYFANKDALLAAAAQQHLQDAAAGLASLVHRLDEDPAPPPHELLEEFLRAMLVLHAGRPRLHRLILERPALGPEFHAAVDAFESAIAVQVGAYLRRLNPSREHPDLEARLLVDAVDTLAHRQIARSEAGGTDTEAFVVTAARLLGGSVVMGRRPPA